MILEDYIVRFDRKDRSSFSYWFAHWCAFQLTALNYKRWKPKYLFHDIEKPWLKLFLSYKKVQRIHNKHNKHHLLYYFIHEKADWEAMIIDWECGRLTKQQCPRNAVDEYYRIFDEFERYINNDEVFDNKSIIYFEEHKDKFDKEKLRSLIACAYINMKVTFETKFGIKVIKYNEKYLLK